MSELENGKYELGNLTASRLAALARGLQWTLAELESALEVDFGLTAYEESSEVGFPAPLYPQREEVYLPEGLVEAIRLHGDVYPELKDPDIQRQMSLARNFAGPPVTAREWLRYFVANQPWLSKDTN